MSPTGHQTQSAQRWKPPMSIEAMRFSTTNRLQSEPHISQIRDTLRTFEDQTFGQLLMGLTPDPVDPGPGSGGKRADPVSKVVLIRSLKVPFNKVLLDNEADVDAYLQVLRSAMQEQLDKNNRIQV
jgi:hypothetical protein